MQSPRNILWNIFIIFPTVIHLQNTKWFLQLEWLLYLDQVSRGSRETIWKQNHQSLWEYSEMIDNM